MEQSKKTPRQDPSNTNVRCTACGALLAKISNGELTVRRGTFQVSVVGNWAVSLVCYLPGCRKVTAAKADVHRS